MSEVKRTQQGRVVSDKMDKSITVAIERFVKHQFTVSSLNVRLKYTHMTKTTSVALATLLKSQSVVHCLRLSLGLW